MHQLCRLFALCALIVLPGVPAAGSTVTGVTVTPGTADAGATVTATVTGAAGYCGAVHIDWGDEQAVTYATEKLPVSQTHVYKGGGTFTVRAQGMGNCTGEATTRVVIKGPPIVAQLTGIVVAPNTATPGTAVRVELQGSGTCRLTLDFGDGNRQQVERGLPATVPHTYAQAGGYTIAATPEAPCGERRTATIEVAAKEGPPRLTGIEIGYAGPSSSGMRRITVGGTGTCQYRIDYGDGNSETRTRALPDTLEHNYPAAGRYEVVATAAGACTGTARSTITVDRAGGGGREARGEIHRLDVRPQVARTGDAVALAVAGTGTCRLTLDFDDGNARSVTTALPARFTHRFAAAGDYEIVVWADEPCAGVGEAVVRVR